MPLDAPSNPHVIAIDGPAASGKSSTAAAVADHLGLVHIDSGALYRAVTWLTLRDGLDGARAIVTAAELAPLTLEKVGNALVVRAGARDIDAEIRVPSVTGRVSAVSAIPEVREWVNKRLRAAVAASGGAVVDGRDIGTVVFPEAPLKVFLTATAEARAERRLRQQGDAAAPAEVAREAGRLEERDRRDASRLAAPMRRAVDAVVVDTSTATFEEQVARIVALAAARGLLPA